MANPVSVHADGSPKHALARRGEGELRALMRRHNRRLYRIARGILKDETEAEDAVQEAYYRAFTHLDDFRGEAALATWLCRIVMNEALGRLRRRRPTESLDTVTDEPRRSGEILPFPGADPAIDPERGVAQRQISVLLERAIDELPPEFRLVLIARVVEEMSIEETAALLDIKPETVKTRLHRARQMLRKAIERQAGPMLTGVFPFEDPRCERVADAVMARLKKA